MKIFLFTRYVELGLGRGDGERRTVLFVCLFVCLLLSVDLKADEVANLFAYLFTRDPPMMMSYSECYKGLSYLPTYY